MWQEEGHDSHICLPRELSFIWSHVDEIETTILWTWVLLSQKAPGALLGDKTLANLHQICFTVQRPLQMPTKMFLITLVYSFLGYLTHLFQNLTFVTVLKIKWQPEADFEHDTPNMHLMCMYILHNNKSWFSLVVPAVEKPDQTLCTAQSHPSLPLQKRMFLVACACMHVNFSVNTDKTVQGCRIVLTIY